MSKVWCASIECKYNKKNQCKAKEISLSDGHVHTVHQGFLQIWKCRAFEESERTKQMSADIAKYLGLEQERK